MFCLCGNSLSCFSFIGSAACVHCIMLCLIKNCLSDLCAVLVRERFNYIPCRYFSHLKSLTRCSLFIHYTDFLRSPFNTHFIKSNISSFCSSVMAQNFVTEKHKQGLTIHLSCIPASSYLGPRDSAGANSVKIRQNRTVRPRKANKGVLEICWYLPNKTDMSGWVVLLE